MQRTRAEKNQDCSRRTQIGVSTSLFDTEYHPRTSRAENLDVPSRATKVALRRTGPPISDTGPRPKAIRLNPGFLTGLCEKSRSTMSSGSSRNIPAGRHHAGEVLLFKPHRRGTLQFQLGRSLRLCALARHYDLLPTANAIGIPHPRQPRTLKPASLKCPAAKTQPQNPRAYEKPLSQVPPYAP